MKKALVVIIFLGMLSTGITMTTSETKNQQIKEGNSLLRSLHKQIKCTYRGDCTDEQTLQIRRNLKRLFYLTVFLVIGYEAGMFKTLKRRIKRQLYPWIKDKHHPRVKFLI